MAVVVQGRRQGPRGVVGASGAHVSIAPRQICGLLDVLVLSLTPVVAGAGRRPFDDPGHLVRLRLTDSTTVC